MVQFDKNFSAARSTTENSKTSKPSGEAEAAASSRPDCCDAKAKERGYPFYSSTPALLVLNSDIDAATRFLHDLDHGLEVPWLLGDHRVAHPGHDTGLRPGAGGGCSGSREAAW